MYACMHAHVRIRAANNIPHGRMQADEDSSERARYRNAPNVLPPGSTSNSFTAKSARRGRSASAADHPSISSVMASVRAQQHKAKARARRGGRASDSDELDDDDDEEDDDDHGNDDNGNGGGRAQRTSSATLLGAPSGSLFSPDAQGGAAPHQQHPHLQLMSNDAARMLRPPAWLLEANGGDGCSAQAPAYPTPPTAAQLAPRVTHLAQALSDLADTEDTGPIIR